MTEFYTSLEDPAVMARFYSDPKLNPFATKQARETNPESEPVYIEQIMIEIRIKGSSEIVRRQMQERDKKRFAAAWAVYEGEQIAPDSGTPLDTLADLDDVTIAQYKQRGINSVEDLAGVSDGIVAQLGRGSIMNKKKASEYLKNHNDVSNKTEVMRRIERLEQMVADLTRNGAPPTAVDDSAYKAFDSRLSALELALVDVASSISSMQSKPQTGAKTTAKPEGKKEKLKLREAASDAA